MPGDPEPNLSSVFISYGGPDEGFAVALSLRLEEHGIENFIFSRHAKFGQPLHEVMRQAVDAHDKVIVICSRESLHRMGVLNEVEETLKKEAREGGSNILLPLTLDKYVYEEWDPEKKVHAQAFRERVIGDFCDAEPGSEKFDAQFGRLLEALGR